MKKIVLAITGGIVLIFTMGPMTIDHAGENFQYIGASKCKMCHKGAINGEIYEIWQNSKHARAYETLANEESKAIANQKGIADPQKDARCLKCHVTGSEATAAAKATTWKFEEGVSCESCHGPGSVYKSLKNMKDLYENKIEPASVGLIAEPMKSCGECHNEESPTFKKIDFASSYKKIEHHVGKKSE